LKKYDLVTDCLKLEITESAYMDQPQELMTTIQQFQKTGFKILMDDFGSGFSSLNMLKDVNVDILKIDMRFMESLETSDRAGNILFSIIQMAKGIHMEVIAEGVETENQYELLVSMDCDGVQGYYFYKPLMEEEIGRKLDEEALEKSLTRTAGQKSILVVDDVEMERELLCRIIEGDYHVLTAASVDRAMEILKREFANIALVITDIIMPDKNGFVLLKQMKKMMFFSSIPVLMMTADGEYENVEKAISMGALDVIGKPFDAPILRQRLKNILKISERETVSREIHALKENVVLRKQLDSLLEDSVAGIARVRLCHDEPYAIKEVVYVNDRFLYFHQIQEPETLNRKALYQLMKNTLSGDLEALGKKFEKAVKAHEKFVGGEYHLEGDNGFYKNMYVSCTIRYYQEEILLDLLVMECRTGVEYQLDRSMQTFSELLGVQTGLGAWRYYPID
ncbi:MAG TPA: EAL domain-containing protein, partial [Lachnospiraceae bacterium]|nr:EAL domain-containing protein [Lachnospiraceae bacterium]